MKAGKLSKEASKQRWIENAPSQRSISYIWYKGFCHHLQFWLRYTYYSGRLDGSKFTPGFVFSRTTGILAHGRTNYKSMSFGLF